jgi:hypothetical protein
MVKAIIRVEIACPRPSSCKLIALLLSSGVGIVDGSDTVAPLGIGYIWRHMLQKPGKVLQRYRLPGCF